MLQTAEGLKLANGRIDGRFDVHDGWIAMPVAPETQQLRVYLGDPASGPLVWLFDGAPSEPPQAEPQPGMHPEYTHLHRTPTFRIALGDQPRQLMLNNAWYGSGEWFLLDARKKYTDPNGVDGFRSLLIFADRRGTHPAMQGTAWQSSDELIAWNAKLFGPFGQGLASFHTADEQAVAGAAITTREALDHGGRARGSLWDQSDWTPLADGSRIAGVFMGDALAGPAVIMSENAPHAVESPAGRCGGDQFRLIVRGSCTIGGKPYEVGAFVAAEAGTPIEAVVHGPRGSTQLLVVSDRRTWAPVDEGGEPIRSARINEITGVLTAFLQRH